MTMNFDLLSTIEVGNISKFIYDYLAKDDSYGTIYYWQWMGSHTRALDWYICTWSWLIPIVKVKIKHISPDNILEIVTDRVKMTTSIKQQVMYGLSIGLITFDFNNNNTWTNY